MTTIITIESIEDFFNEGKPEFLKVEQAICYIASVLLKGNASGTELMKIRKNVPNQTINVSDTILSEIAR